MLKASHYILISAFFVFVFILLMAFNSGIYSVTGNILPKTITMTANDTAAEAPSGETEYAIITGADINTNTVQNSIFAIKSLKSSYATYDSLESFVAGDGNANFLIIATANIYLEDAVLIKNILAEGCNVIFAVIPTGAYSSDSELRDLLGMSSIQKKYTVEGFDIYAEILLGGTFHAEKWSFECAKVTLTGRNKVYANGFNPFRNKSDLVMDSKDKNPIIWRTYYEGSAIFVINAPFMENSGGIGIITGMLAIENGDFIYSIIGANSILIKDFPYIADTNQKLHNRSIFAFSRDIMWTDLISISRESNLVFTFYTNGNFSKNGSSDTIIKYFAEAIYKDLKGEMGYVIQDGDNIFGNDIKFLNQHFYNYKFHSYMNPLESSSWDADIVPITSVILPSLNQYAFTKVSDNAITLPIISQGTADEEENLKFTGVYSALGLIMHSLDLSKPFVSGLSDDGEWNKYAVNIAKHFSYLFKNTDFIPSMTVSQTAELTKNYMNTNYDVTKTDDGITVSMSNNSDEILFILRTMKDITKTVNCAYEKIEDNIYLIKSKGPEFKISLEKKKH